MLNINCVGLISFPLLRIVVAAGILLKVVSYIRGVSDMVVAVFMYLVYMYLAA